ncbi:MAG TPA: hypothetical protein VMO26_25300 [Vicinamibacterales bacterium]|nr:hypothetical protein [Vicinamibacterales bacterium]
MSLSCPAMGISLQRLRRFLRYFHVGQRIEIASPRPHLRRGHVDD